MAFQLYRLENGQYVGTAFRDLADKAFWCILGNDKEAAFVRLAEQHPIGHAIAIHPAKAADPSHPDLLVDGQDIGEVRLKTRRSSLGETMAWIRNSR